MQTPISIKSETHLAGAIGQTSGPGSGHATLVISEWETLRARILDHTPIIIDGSSLDIASIVAVARYRLNVYTIGFYVDLTYLIDMEFPES
jgi:hypothetical protein